MIDLCSTSSSDEDIMSISPIKPMKSPIQVAQKRL